MKTGLKNLQNTKIWTIAADFGEILIDHIKKHQPKIIVELGSGYSTILITKTVKDTSPHKFISLEHDIRFYIATFTHLKNNSLHTDVDLALSPLKEYVISNETWQWYDIKTFNRVKNIDMVIIDGPPGYIQHCARYPALPLLYKKLNKHTALFLDDAKRKDEQMIIKRWKSEFPEFTVETINTQRGTAIFSR